MIDWVGRLQSLSLYGNRIVTQFISSHSPQALSIVTLRFSHFLQSLSLQSVSSQSMYLQPLSLVTSYLHFTARVFGHSAITPFLGGSGSVTSFSHSFSLSLVTLSRHSLSRVIVSLWGGYDQYAPYKCRSLLQDIVSFIGLLFKRDLQFQRAY